MERRRILDLTDLTYLDSNASENSLRDICNLSMEKSPAALCVFSEHVEFVSRHLDESVTIAAVAGGFPEGSGSPDEIYESVREAVSYGAKEIDCVLEPGPEGSFPGEDELAKLIAMREASQGLVLKVIVESPLLDERSLRAVTRMVMASGADFVKTCTGRRGDCSLEVVRILAEEVSRHSLISEKPAGLKISGGIKTRQRAESLIQIIAEQDKTIITPTRLRIGASSLVGNL